MELCRHVDSDPTLGNSLFGAVKLVNKTEIDKYQYSGSDIGFDMKGIFSFPTGEFGKNVLIFVLDMSSSAHVNKKKDILILCEGPKQA